MNKFRCVILLGACLWPSVLWAQFHMKNIVQRPEVQKHNLKGQVWKITQVQSPVSNKAEDFLDGFSGQNYQEEYNREGRMQKRISCDDANKPRAITRYDYDRDGRVTVFSIEALAPDLFGTYTNGQVTYDYNDARNTFTTHDNRTIMGKALHRRTEVVRDTINRFLMNREYQQDTLLAKEQFYWWDKQGYVTKQISRYRNLPSDDIDLNKDNFKTLFGSLSGQEERALDSMMRKQDSLKIQQFRNQPEWRIDTTVYQNKYDQLGRITQQETYRNDKKTDASQYVYGLKANQIIRQSYSMKGELLSETFSLLHPTQGYILSDSSRSKNNGQWEARVYKYADHHKAKSPYRYQYDSQGNWIEQKRVDANGQPIGVALVRKIEYYP